MNNPFLSIVIANYNYGRFLEEAIRSVVDQCIGIEKALDGRNLLRLANCECVELIVCDAGSTDNSFEIIQRSAQYLSWWCSEHDQGQSDAFNKGFSHATGRLLTWLNADDLMVPGSLLRLSEMARKNPSVEWFAGGSIWMDAEGHIVRCTRARNAHKEVVKSGYVPVYAASSFFSKRILDKIGGVNVDFHYKMDTLMWLEFYHDLGIRYCVLPGHYFVARIHPDAKVNGLNAYNKEPPPQMQKETNYLREHYPPQKSHKWLQCLSSDGYKLLWNAIETKRYRGCVYNDVKHCFA